jgi:hypothetical protein
VQALNNSFTSAESLDLEEAEAQIIASSKVSIERHHLEGKKHEKHGDDGEIEAAEGWITEHALSPKKLAKLLNSDFSADKGSKSNGLSAEDAKQRLIDDGKHIIFPPQREILNVVFKFQVRMSSARKR